MRILERLLNALNRMIFFIYQAIPAMDTGFLSSCWCTVSQTLLSPRLNKYVTYYYTHFKEAGWSPNYIPDLPLIFRDDLFSNKLSFGNEKNPYILTLKFDNLHVHVAISLHKKINIFLK